jgi:hypothetical protein
MQSVQHISSSIDVAFRFPFNLLTYLRLRNWAARHLWFFFFPSLSLLWLRGIAGTRLLAVVVIVVSKRHEPKQVGKAQKKNHHWIRWWEKKSTWLRKKEEVRTKSTACAIQQQHRR